MELQYEQKKNSFTTPTLKPDKKLIKAPIGKIKDAMESTLCWLQETLKCPNYNEHYLDKNDAHSDANKTLKLINN